MLGIFNVRTDVNACDCTQRLCGRRKRVCAERWLGGGGNPQPHRGIEPASAACRSDALPTELHPRPKRFLGEFSRYPQQDLCWIVPHVPPTTQSIKRLNWTELGWYGGCRVKKNNNKHTHTHTKIKHAHYVHPAHSGSAVPDKGNCKDTRRRLRCKILN